MDSDPYGYSDDLSAVNGADVGGSEGERPGASLCGGATSSDDAGGQTAGAGESSRASADPCRQAPLAAALPDTGEATSNPYEADLARSFQRDRDAYERIYDPLRPPKELTLPSYDAGDLNGGTRGFDPYDLNSILAPSGQPARPGAPPSGTNALGSPLQP
jgi:hypothetical protein